MPPDKTIDDLRSAFTPEWVVAIHPDHPYLLTAPDALGARRGRLLAFFVPLSK